MVKRYRLIKKRVYRKRRSYNKKRRVIRSRKPNNMGFRPLGLKHAAKLRYCETITLNPGVGLNTTHIFSANGCYDPNTTGVGHQPYGFDQLMSMYNHFTVVGSQCTIKLANSSGSLPYYAGILLRDSATATSTTLDTSLILEQPGNKMKLLGYGASGAGGGPNSMKCKFSTRKFFTKNRGAIIEDALLRGDATSNPTEQAYYHIMLAPQTASDDINLQAIMVIIDYYVVFTEPKILTSS